MVSLSAATQFKGNEQCFPSDACLSTFCERKTFQLGVLNLPLGYITALIKSALAGFS